MGGVGYAAVAIPANSISNAMLKNNSVGNIKLRSNSVSYTKIAPGSVGTARIDQEEIQGRINGTCATGTQAITAIARRARPPAARRSRRVRLGRRHKHRRWHNLDTNHTRRVLPAARWYVRTSCRPTPYITVTPERDWHRR